MRKYKVIAFVMLIASTILALAGGFHTAFAYSHMLQRVDTGLDSAAPSSALFLLIPYLVGILICDTVFILAVSKIKERTKQGEES